MFLSGLAPALPVGPFEVRAGGGLVTVMDATYDAMPDLARVHVTIDAVSTSHEADTAEGQIYFTGITVSVPSGSSSIAASSGSVPLAVATSVGPDAVRVDVDFSTGVFFGQSYAYRISFDMVDPGGAADRDFRIGRSVVAFPVWAWGSDGAAGNSVVVLLPGSFTPSVYGGPMSQVARADGTVQLSAAVDHPSTWFAYVTAERPGIYTTTPFTVRVGDADASVVIRAWDDDPGWGARTTDLLMDGLPTLHELIGLPWAVFGDLKVEESANRLGDYAGIYNRLTEKINVRYDADATVTLHEAAHIWFNGDLFRDRWIGEAWAEFYAVQAAQEMGLTGDTFELTDDLLTARIPLNDWGGIGQESEEVEAFAYAASLHIAQLIFERTDLEELRAVWWAANEGEMAYQPLHGDGPPRTGVAFSQEGWERLLDLLEERTGAAYDDLWSTWVVNDAQQTLMADRAQTRTRYFEVAALAADWDLPEQIRYELGSWQFDDVLEGLDTAVKVLAVADDVAAAADDLALTPPDTLRAAFEGTDGLDAALDEAHRELDAAVVVQDATDELATDPGFVGWVGLLFAEPNADLVLARQAWEGGDSTEATERAEAVLRLLGEADDHGRERLLAAGGVALVAVGGGATIAWRRRRSQEAAAQAN